ncbi:hypothetical protein ROZALSC1DRAFT_29054 [Rozella allomycis CSF55]|uniref:tRNA(Phe) 7-[(3-amino-3-carboxypropyl)-4-demethylwyosine(37)-N(4)]-methyltransferase n=1 Tax=Rozella allomycis (strain CSF55) TaxID=988480 RepID=A0A075B4V9_ROZAC|nr:tRNA wybutosine-synthesizing protein domain-containing protein [Rozella allomycis CSF55]RKP19339.1 hypothetical protein ROZALSC1DRAFT_29054 [Rozella allomycis CSF55]|eukprot:EPZ36521.1 tRNA wybutosine-synthesizing protein domain-containing protein [Rozella allomycis CSF55]
MELINNSPYYNTTSSCSGRVSIFVEKSNLENGFWLFVSHDPLSENSLSYLFPDKKVDFVDSCTFEEVRWVYFKFEPFVLHIEANSVESAQKIFTVAYNCGYRNSGCIIGKKRSMVAFRSTLKLDVPIGYYEDGIVKLIVSSDYLKTLVQISNGKFQENIKRMDRLYADLLHFFEK